MRGEYDASGRSRRRKAADRAAQQWGYVAGWQLRGEDGVTPAEIKSWRRSGWLERRYEDVFAVGHEQRSQQACFMAAVLALGPGAVLSHISAAVLWGMIRIRQSWIDVTTTKKLRSRADIKAHFSRGFESTTHQGIAVKTPLETVLDLAECIRKDELLIRAINQGLADELYTLESLDEHLRNARGRHGVKRLRRLMHLVTKSRSGLEDRAFAEAVANGHRPQTNHRIDGMEVDQYDPITNTALEIDSAKYHGNPFARYLDAIKSRRLAKVGVRTLRVDEDDVAAS